MIRLHKVVEFFNEALKIAKKEGINFIAITGNAGSTFEVVEVKIVDMYMSNFGLKKKYIKPTKEKVIIATLKEGFAILDDYQCRELVENSKRWIDWKKDKKKK